MLESNIINENSSKVWISRTVIRITPQPGNISDNPEPMKDVGAAHQACRLLEIWPLAGAAADSLLGIAQQDIRSRRYCL